MMAFRRHGHCPASALAAFLVFGFRRNKFRQSADFLTPVGQEGHILVCLQALTFKQGVAIFGHRLANDNLEVGFSVVPVTYIAAIEANHDAAFRDGQSGPIRRTVFNETRPLLPEFSLGALAHTQHMLAQGFGVGAGLDRQDVGQQSSRGGVGHKRRPSCLDVEPLRSDVIGDQVAQRRHGGRADRVLALALAAMQSWAIQFDVPIQRAEHNRVTAFAAPLVAADRARAMPTRPRRGLDFDRSVLDRGEQHLALGDRQAKVLQPLRHLVERRDLLGRAGGAVIAGDLEQDPDAHGMPSIRIARDRAFHNRRSGKLEVDPACRPLATLARMGRCCMDPCCGWRPEPGRRRVIPFSLRKPAVPFKHHAEHSHRIPKPRYRVPNWREYDAALRRRGSLTVWFTDEAVAAWRAEPRTTPRGPPYYSALAITTALTMRAVFRLALRQTEGLIGSVITLLGLALTVPDHSTMCRRSKTLVLPPLRRSETGPLHLLVDSSGLKPGGAGEWLVEKHGTSRRRSWRKLHIGIDAGSGDIVAIELTEKDVDDAARTGALLDQVSDPIASFTADGAYDQDRVYEAVAERHPDAKVIVPPRSTATLSASAGIAPTRRDQHIREIAEHGRMGWQKSSDYNIRAKVEAAIDRYKRVIGDALRSRTDKTEATEVAIAAAALNRMPGLGRPNYVRIV